MSSDADAGYDHNVHTITCPKSGEIILVVNQLSRFLTEFEELKFLGSGGFGIVTLCKSKVDDMEYAIKKYRLDLKRSLLERLDLKRSRLDLKRREVRIIAGLDHPNIIRYYSAWVDPSFKGIDRDFEDDDDVSDSCWERAKNSDCPCLYIQVQLCDESLRDVLDSSDPPRRHGCGIFDQIMNALVYLHNEKGIVHMDLTPDNIFVDKKGSIRIGDFGLARLVGESTIRLEGKFLYQPPEKEDVVSSKYDMYFIGVLLFEWLYAFKTRTERCQILKNLKKGGEDLADEVEKVDANDLTKKVLTLLLDRNPEMRLSASELKSNLTNMLDV